MNKFALSTFAKGWFVGNFDPSIINTEAFECAVKYYKKGDVEKRHLHKLATEITVIVRGKFKMNESLFIEGDIVKVEKNEAVDFECLEDGITVVIKTPSVMDDKFFV